MTGTPLDRAVPMRHATVAAMILAGEAGRRLAAALLAERERWPLWFPVGLGVGVGLYFLLRAEPSWWLGAAVSVACALALAIFWRRTPAALDLPPIFVPVLMLDRSPLLGRADPAGASQ